MKKIITKKIYDTDTAKAVASYSNGYSCGNPYHISETLYRKRTGEFFLYGFGGCMTEYSEFENGIWWSGENIFPLTEENAKVWVTAFCDADTYIALFGEAEE